MPQNIRDWLSWLIKLRIVVATTLLGVILGVESAAASGDSASGLFRTTLCIYLAAVVHYLLLRLNSRYVGQAYFQILSDLSIISAIVYFTGGIDSYFPFLYSLSIIMASILLYRKGALIAASLSSLLLAGQHILTQQGLLPSTVYAALDPRTVKYLIGTNIFAFYAVAYLSSYLSECLKRTGSELEDKRGELAALQAFNENIINSMRGGLFATNLDGVITLFNKSANEITGYSPERIVGTHVSRAFGQANWAGAGVPEESLPFRFEKTIKNGRGADTHLGFTVSRFLLEDQRHVGYVYTFQDLTEIKALEEQVARKDRMAVMGSMAATIAHEIRNPLTAISGSFHVLKGELPLDAAHQQLAENISVEIKRLYRIITDFLAYAKPMNYSPRLVDLKELTCDTINLIKNSTEISGRHEIECSFDSKHSWHCQGDPDLLKQVYWNLCGNAVKAMPEGGRLSIQLEDAPQGSVKISFRDTGTGLTREEQEKIFHPFQSSFSDGVGLGLSVVSQIVAAHQGAIQVTSTKGKGTTFQITLPRQAASH
ncbi:MAG: ATP-binding protein [Acidobacteria bacterium]|nr:ATP-binding protein [Acidobacteriota bacterium]